MRRNLAVGVVVIGFLAVAGRSVGAHHAFAAEFDSTQTVTLRGTVSKMEWVNPHSWLYVDVKNADGTVERWAVECSPPNTLLRSGWNKLSLVPGTEVVVEGFRAKRAKLVANGRNVTLPDGTKLLTGAPPGSPDAPPEK
jgi:hypothetical protein